MYIKTKSKHQEEVIPGGRYETFHQKKIRMNNQEDKRRMKTSFLCPVNLNNVGRVKQKKNKERIILEAIGRRHFKEDVLNHVRSHLR